MSINLYAMNRIKGPQPNSGSQPGGTASSTLSSRKAETALGTAEKIDTVTISSQGTFKRDIAKMTKGVLAEIGQFESSYSARVEDLRTRIENNTYQISPEKLADAILTTAFSV